MVFLCVGQPLQVDDNFNVTIIDITAISARVTWSVPENNDNTQYRLQYKEEGLCVTLCRLAHWLVCVSKNGSVSQSV